EGLLRRGLEPTLAAAVEVHRRRMELDQNSRGLHRRGLAPDVVLGELAKPELARTTALPQETDVEILRELLALAEEFRARGALEGELHVRRLDLGSAPVRALDLEGGGALAEHRADLQVAVFFIEKLHARRIPRCARDAAESSAGCGRRRPPRPARTPRSGER